MKFFVPAAANDEEAERVFDAFVRFNHAPKQVGRICALNWNHNGQTMTCAIGAPLPPYYGTGREPVLAILDCDHLYKICTENRGGVRGEAVLAGKNGDSHATYFD